MSSWTTRIKLRKRVLRLIAALIAGIVVKLLAIIVLVPSVFYFLGGPEAAPELFALIFAVMTSFPPLYVTVWIHWGLNPDSRTTAWTRKARLIAVASGFVVEVAVYILLALLLIPVSTNSSQSAELLASDLLIIVAGSFFPAGIIAIWLFGRLKPAEEEGPISRWRRRKRLKAGLCGTCGYNLRGLTEQRCPECSTEFDPSTLPSTSD